MKLDAYGQCPQCLSVIVVDVDTIGPNDVTVCRHCFEPLTLGPSTCPRGAAWRVMAPSELTGLGQVILLEIVAAMRARGPLVYA